jgi:hypothetical protein
LNENISLICLPGRRRGQSGKITVGLLPAGEFHSCSLEPASTPFKQVAGDGLKGSPGTKDKDFEVLPSRPN